MDFYEIIKTTKDTIGDNCKKEANSHSKYWKYSDELNIWYECNKESIGGITHPSFNNCSPKDWVATQQILWTCIPSSPLPLIFCPDAYCIPFGKDLKYSHEMERFYLRTKEDNFTWFCNNEVKEDDNLSAESKVNIKHFLYNTGLTVDMLTKFITTSTIPQIFYIYEHEMSESLSLLMLLFDNLFSGKGIITVENVSEICHYPHHNIIFLNQVLEPSTKLFYKNPGQKLIIIIKDKMPRKEPCGFITPTPTKLALNPISPGTLKVFDGHMRKIATQIVHYMLNKK